ncbi:MAG: hypothetical protein WAX69_11305 [Victivallales bacterium]
MAYDNTSQVHMHADKDRASVVVVFDANTEAEEAVKKLKESSFDMTKLSIIGKDYQDEQHVVGYYNTGELTGYRGKFAAFCGGFWGPLFGSALFMVPGIGPLFVGGPLVGWIVGVLDGAAVAGGISVVGAALHNIGIPKENILKYENFLKSSRFLVIVHGSTGEVCMAWNILQYAKSIETNVHGAGHR